MRIQFRPSTIFVLMLVVAAFFGGVAVQRLETERVRREMEAARDQALMEREKAIRAVDEMYRMVELQSRRQQSQVDSKANRAE